MLNSKYSIRDQLSNMLSRYVLSSSLQDETSNRPLSQETNVMFKIKWCSCRGGEGVQDKEGIALQRRVLLQLLMDKYLNDVMLGKCIKEKKKDYSFNNPAGGSIPGSHHKEPDIPLGYVAYLFCFVEKSCPLYNMKHAI
ncbi:hypothetical protein CFP56_018374, partial [Quercus suber]